MQEPAGLTLYRMERYIKARRFAKFWWDVIDSIDNSSINLKQTDMELSKKERHEVYKLAKWFFDEGGLRCMCDAISEAAYELYYDRWYNSSVNSLSVPDFFPEMKALEPPELFNRLYFWPIDDRAIRERMFRVIIEQTREGGEK